MNPRIHHPSWYQAVGLLSEAEKEAALAGGIACTTPLSTFRAADFEIVCLEDRWEIKTLTDTSRARILETSVAVFDKLFHTPIAAYGLNVVAERTTGLDDVARFIGEQLKKIPLGLADDNELSGSIRIRCGSGQRQLTMAVEASLQNRGMIQVNMNFHHPIRTDSAKQFDLGPMLRDAFENDINEATARIAKLVAELNRYSGG